MTISEPAGGAISPLSARPPKKIRELPRGFLLDELERYYGAKPPTDAVEIDYSLWECADSGLQFAWPMQPGNACFYEWVSSFSSYYPGTRWEYGKVAGLLDQMENPNGQVNVLDVGCGSGNFLSSLGIPRENLFGLDLNEPAVEDCRKLGFKAFCGVVDAALEAGFVAPGRFSTVTAFHCLEHVPDPVGFMRSLVKITAPGGRVFVSTPYSPMSFEMVYFDVMNHPPHHMTRWNLAAYSKLAKMLDVEMRYYVPPSSIVRSALSAFRLLRYSPTESIGRAKVAMDALLHLPKFAGLYRQQKERARTNGGISADAVLVEFRIA